MSSGDWRTHSTRFDSASPARRACSALAVCPARVASARSPWSFVTASLWPARCSRAIAASSARRRSFAAMALVSAASRRVRKSVMVSGCVIRALRRGLEVLEHVAAMHRDHDGLLIKDVRHVGGVAAPLGAGRINSSGLREKRLADIHCPAAARSMSAQARLSHFSADGSIGASVSRPKRGSPTASCRTKNQPRLSPTTGRAAAVSSRRGSPRASSRVRSKPMK